MTRNKEEIGKVFVRNAYTWAFVVSLAACLLGTSAESAEVTWERARPRYSLFAHHVLEAAKTSGHTLEETVSKLKAVGITGFDADYAQPQVGRLVAAGLEPVNFYGLVKFLSPDGGAAQTEAFLASAGKYGVRRIMVIPDAFSDGGDREDEYAKMRDGLRHLARAAKAKGIVAMIEDFGGVTNPCSETRYLRRFLEDIPELGFALDSGNLHYANRGEDILAFAKSFSDRIRHVHLKDFRAMHSREYVSVGTGVVPNESIVKFVDSLGYDGWYTLENPVGENLLADAIRQEELVTRWWAFGHSPDYVPGLYRNARERAANSLKYSWAPNRMLEKIAAGQVALGGYLELGDPVVAEAAGLAGLEFVWIDAEHHPYTVRDIMLVDIALKGTGCASLVRVRSQDPDYLKQLLDTGIDGVIVPMVNSVEEANSVISACRYPQAGGCRGICVSRQTGYGKMSTFDYLKRSETAPFICLEIEHVDAIRDVDEILALDGYDAIMVGPSDLSCSMGSLKLASDRKVRERIVEISRKTQSAGKLFFAIGLDWFQEMGGRTDFVSSPSDLYSFTASVRRFLKEQESQDR